MIKLVISDTDGNELESLELSISEVLPYVNLLKEFTYLSEDGDEYKFKRVQVLSERYVYVDMEIQ